MKPLTTVGRLGLAAFGLFLMLAGMVAWSWVNEYGAGINWTTESAGDGIERLYIVEQAPDPDGSPDMRFMFEGTPQEVFEFAETYEAERRSYVVALLIFGTGILIVIVAIIYPRTKREIPRPEGIDRLA